MKVIQVNETIVIDKAVETLLKGGLIVFPTETCYGLGVDATNSEAVDRLLAFKTKREGKAISVVVTDEKMAEKYVELNETARHLYRTFLPGPITVISKIKANNDQFKIDLRLLSEKETLGVRIPAHDLIIEIVKKLGRPVTATSANSSGKPNPYSLEQWEKQTATRSRNLVDLWIDDGTLVKRPSSTVIDTTSDELTVVRQGAIVIDSPTLEQVTRSERETFDLAGDVIATYADLITKHGLVIGLQGDLGAGKTRFAKGVALALEIEEEVRSPTFTLLEEYVWEKGVFFHIDTWRMESVDEMESIRFDELLKPGNVVVVEWIEKVSEAVQLACEQSRAELVLLTVHVVADGSRLWRMSRPIVSM